VVVDHLFRSDDNPIYDIIVLCAKQDEQRVIVDHFKTVFERQEHFNDVYNVTTSKGSPLRLLVTLCGDMGNITAASRTGYLLGQYRPNLIVFVGTSGSLNPAKCNIGDVVVPDLGVQTLSYNKIVDAEDNSFHRYRGRGLKADILPAGIDGTEYAFRHDNVKGNVSLSNRSRQDISRAREKNEDRPKIESLLRKHVLNSDPKIHFDVQVFSWEKVVATGHYRDKLNQQFDRAYIVDMESYGFLEAAGQYQQDKPLRAIIVRGVSDLCAGKSTSGEKGLNDYAVENAAIVAAEIISRASFDT
jgi:nucleoside phosphorylase